MAFLNGWYYKKKLTIDSSIVTSIFIDAVVRIVLDSSKFNFSDAKADGADVRFTADDGETFLDFERVFHGDDGGTDKAIYYIKIPVISDSVDTDFYMYYGNADASDSANSGDVWDDNFYKMVLHLSETGNGTLGEYLDSTTYNNAGQGGGGVGAAVPTCVTSLLFKGQSHDGGDFIKIPDSPDLEFLNLNITISLKINFNSTAGNQCFLGRPGKSSYFYFAKEGGGIRLRDYNIGIDMSVAWTPGTSVDYDLEITRNGNDIKVFIDDTEVMSQSTAISFLDRNEDWQIGANTGINYYSQAIIDEVRFTIGLDRGAAWRAVRIASDNDTLITYGEVESPMVPASCLECAYASEATTNAAGLNHLEGQNVSILANGEVLGQQTVINGAIDLSDWYSVVKIGLPFFCDLETLNVEIPLQDANSIQGRRVKINNVTFRIHNSRGGYIGPDEDNLFDAFTQEAFRQCSGENLSEKDLFTGDVRQPLGGEFSAGGRVFCRQSDPLPITIGAIMPEVNVGGYSR